MNRLILTLFFCHILYRTLFAAHQDTLGTEFFLGFPCYTAVDAYLRTQQDKGCSQCDIKYSTGSHKKVTVGEVPFIENICARRTNPEQIISIEIACDVEISVAVRSPDTTTRILPKSVLDTSYILSNPTSNTATKTQAIITATRDNTDISYGVSSNLTSLRLNRMENLTVKLDTRDSTTVLQINSDKDVAVLYGIAEAVPGSNADKYSFTAIPPKSRLGVNYILQQGYSYIISGIYNSTNCTTSEGQELLLDEMADNITHLVEPTELQCNEPVLVVSKDEKEVRVIPSTTMFANSYLLYDTANNNDVMLNLYIEKRHLTRELIFNTLPITSLNYTDTPITNSSYVIVQYQVDSPRQQYSINHRNPTAQFYADMRNADGLMIDQPVLRQALTGIYCKKKQMMHNDYLDNDCDYRIDEELLNGIDDDGDGRIDEDIATNTYYSDLREEPEKFWKKSYTVVLIVMSVILTIILLSLLHWKIANWNPEIEGMGTDQDTMISQASTLTVPRQGYRLSGSWSGFTVSRTG